jgi:PPE-repeat protein
MSFMVLPPEINSLRMFSGAGSAPMLQAAAAWDGLASELGSAASSFGSVTSQRVVPKWSPASWRQNRRMTVHPNSGGASSASN